MAIPTEPIGSIPRPPSLIEAARALQSGRMSHVELLSQYDSAVQDTIARFEATGSTVVTDGEQAKDSFVTYPIHGLTNIAANGIPIPFADGHIRQFPRLTAGPFAYRTSADVYLDIAQRYAHVPVKQAVISPSALSLLYPQQRIAKSTWTLSWTNKKARFGAACIKALTRFRSTSRKAGFQSGLIRRGDSCAVSSN